MLKHAGLVTLLAAIVLTPGLVHARGYGRGGTVISPYGPLYNTNSPEWRAAGGNIFVYEQLMEEKMMRQQQQMLMKQQQMWLRQQQQAKKGAAANGGGGFSAQTAPQPARKKKRRTYVPTRSATSPSAKAGATKAATPAKADTVNAAAKTDAKTTPANP